MSETLPTSDHNPMIELLNRIATALEQIAAEPRTFKTKKQTPVYMPAPPCPILSKDKNWKRVLTAYMEEKGNKVKVTSDEIFKDAFKINPKLAKMQTRRTLGAELREQGYEQKQNYKGGKKGYFWTKKRVTANTQQRDAVLKKLFDNSRYVPPTSDGEPVQQSTARNPAPTNNTQTATPQQPATSDTNTNTKNPHATAESLHPATINWLKQNAVPASIGFTEYDILKAANLPPAAARDLAEMLPQLGCKKGFLDGKQGGASAGKTGYFWFKKLPELEELI